MSRIRRWLTHWWSRFGTIRNDVSLRDEEISALEMRARQALDDLERQKREARLDAEAQAMIQERRRSQGEHQR